MGSITERPGAVRALQAPDRAFPFAEPELLHRGAIDPPYPQIRECSRRDRVRSGMREFESSHSSQALLRSAWLPKKCEIRPEMPAFREVGLVSKLPFRRFSSANRRKSPATDAIIPVLWRLWAETGLDLHCVRRSQSF
jgi:hypothetical protein